VDEFRVRRLAQDKLQEVLKAKAAYWKQRNKQKAIRESDANTAYHHAQETQRLQQDVVSHAGKTEALTEYFKSIIGVT